MSSETQANGFSNAKKAVADLFRTVSDLHDDVSENIPHLHDDVGYEEAARKHAVAANLLQDNFSNEVRKAAKKITAISDKGWETNKPILGLWHQVALAVTYFSEHADKPVAALIINEEGKLLSFSANRTLSGVPKQPEHFVRGKRRERIACAEKLAMARLLGIDTRHHAIPGSFDADKHIKGEIQQLNQNIMDAAQKGARLENCFILTTIPSCMTCAQSIAALDFKGVITVEGAGDHFECAEEMDVAQNHLIKQGVSVVYLPQPILV